MVYSENVLNQVGNSGRASAREHFNNSFSHAAHLWSLYTNCKLGSTMLRGTVVIYILRNEKAVFDPFLWEIEAEKKGESESELESSLAIMCSH